MEHFLFALYALAACGGALAVVLSQNVVRMAFYLVISLGATAGLFFLLNADFVGATQLLIYVGGTVVLLIFGVMLTSNAPFQSTQSSPAELLQGGVVGLAFLAVIISSVLAVDWSRNNSQLAAKVEGSPVTGEGYNPASMGNTSRPIGLALLGVRVDGLSAAASRSGDLSVGHGPADHQHADGHSHSHGADGHSHAHGADGHSHAHGADDHSHADAGIIETQTLATGYLLPFEIISVHLLVVLVGAAYLARAKRRSAPASA